MSDLVEKVARAMCADAGFDPEQVMPNDGPRWRYYQPQARAAIAAVAECLRAKRHGCHDYSADFLEKKLEQPKGAAGDGI